MEEKKPVVEDNDVLNPDDFDEEVETEVDAEETDTQSQEKEEQAKKNAHFAEQRRKKEQAEREAREQKIREEATLNAKLGMVKTNPYTNDPISDEDDLEVYELMKQIDDEGGDPISDYPKKLLEIKKKAKAEAKAKADAEEREKTTRSLKIEEEIKELREKYPKVDTSALANDPLFQECLKGKAGRWSQVEIYELYLTKKAQADNEAQENEAKRATEEGSKNVSKTPSSNANGKSNPVKVENMTDAEFEAYWKRKYGN